MEILRRMIVYLSILVLVVIPSSPSTAFATSVSVLPANSNHNVGSFFDVFVDISDVVDLYAFQFDASFDPAVLQAVGSAEGSFLPIGGGTFFMPGTIDNTAGSISFTADSLLGPDPGVTGNGHLALLSFKAFGQGTSPISLSNLLLLDSNISDISFTYNDGSVNVSGNTVPEPTTMLLLGLGLAGISGVKRRFSN